MMPCSLIDRYKHSSKILVPIYQNTRCHVPEDSNLHGHCYENVIQNSRKVHSRGLCIVCSFKYLFCLNVHCFNITCFRGIIFWDITPLATRFQAGFLLSFLLPLRWRRYVPPKRRLTLNGLHGVIFQKMVLFITTSVRTSNPT
jgi:hypothetical protein